MEVLSGGTVNPPDNQGTRRAQAYDPASLPLYCDYSCEHANFAGVDAVGACRRDVGVYCAILDSYVNKHSKCQVRKKSGIDSEGGTGASL
jgi:hypothetical protein